MFHASLGDTLVASAVRVREETRVVRVGFTGGCFQNRILTDAAAARMEAAGFHVLLRAQVPGNDDGISYGQVGDEAVRLL